MDDVGAIAASMRPADQREIMLLSGQEPKQALTECFEQSDVCRTLSYQDTPLIMYGTTPQGIVWGLGSSTIDEHTFGFLRISREEVEILQGDKPLIFNLVHADNELHLKWVKYVGFEIYDAVVHPSGELVHPIRRSK
jgi:hypothetical protein